QVIVELDPLGAVREVRGVLLLEHIEHAMAHALAFTQRLHEFIPVFTHARLPANQGRILACRVREKMAPALKIVGRASENRTMLQICHGSEVDVSACARGPAAGPSEASTEGRPRYLMRLENSY